MYETTGKKTCDRMLTAMDFRPSHLPGIFFVTLSQARALFSEFHDVDQNCDKNLIITAYRL